MREEFKRWLRPDGEVWIAYRVTYRVIGTSPLVMGNYANLHRCFRCL